MTTVCRGDALCNECLGHAFLLNYDVYGQTADEFEWPLDQMIRQNEPRWERDHAFESANENEPSNSQFHFRFYKPVIPDGKDMTDVCPPALVFRGSQGSNPQSFRELTVRLHIRTSNLSWSEPIAGGLAAWNDLGDLHIDHPVLIMGNDPDIGGLERITLFGARDSLRIDFSRLFGLINTHLSLDYEISAYVYHGTNGDYGVNFAQGLGYETDQYTRAMRAGVAAAQEAKDNWGGRLIITGHSLGGGQASAAAAAAKKAHDDVTIWCRTYDASGLHPNTVANFNKASTTQNPQTRCWSIDDEILTTLQSYPSKIPLLTSIFRWAEAANGRPVTMPLAVNSVARNEDGVGPFNGPLPMSGLQVYKRHPLYQLFPLGESGSVLDPSTGTQNVLRREDFTELMATDRIARGARTPEQFLERLVLYALTGNEHGGGGNYISAAWRGFGLKDEGERALPILIASADYHGVDILGFTYFV